jgi:hypothetical protein
VIVYIESNFLQEIALQQREFSFAASILKLAEQGKIQLIFPDIALSNRAVKPWALAPGIEGAFLLRWLGRRGKRVA